MQKKGWLIIECCVLHFGSQISEQSMPNNPHLTVSHVSELDRWSNKAHKRTLFNSASIQGWRLKNFQRWPLYPWGHRCVIHQQHTHSHYYPFFYKYFHISQTVNSMYDVRFSCLSCVSSYLNICRFGNHAKYSNHKTLQQNSTRCTSNVRNLFNLHTKHHDIKVNSVHPRTGEFLLVLVPLPKPSATTVVDCSSDDSEEVVTKIGINTVIKISGSLALKPY